MSSSEWISLSFRHLISNEPCKPHLSLARTSCRLSPAWLRWTSRPHTNSKQHTLLTNQPRYLKHTKTDKYTFVHPLNPCVQILSYSFRQWKQSRCEMLISSANESAAPLNSGPMKRRQTEMMVNYPHGEFATCAFRSGKAKCHLFGLINCFRKIKNRLYDRTPIPLDQWILITLLIIAK